MIERSRDDDDDVMGMRLQLLMSMSAVYPLI